MAKIKMVDRSRKDEIRGKIRSMPIPEKGPYVDLTEWRKIPALYDRFRVGFAILAEEELEELGLPRDHIPEFLICRYFAARHLTNKLQDDGFEFASLARGLGIDKTILSQYNSGARPLSLSVENLCKLAYTRAGEGLQRIMFGETDAVAVLPGFYSALLEQFCQMPTSKRIEISHRAVEYCNEQNTNCCLPGIMATVKERCFMLKDARGIKLKEMFDEKPFYRLYQEFELGVLRDMWDKYPLSLEILMLISLELDMPIDYFVAPNFAKYVIPGYKTQDGYVAVDSEDARRFVGALMSANEDNRAKIAAPVVADMFNSTSGRKS